MVTGVPHPAEYFIMVLPYKYCTVPVEETHSSKYLVALVVLGLRCSRFSPKDQLTMCDVARFLESLKHNSVSD